MPSRSLMSSLVLAGLASTAVLVAAPQAQAQGLLDFLWGGGQEWGGGKQTVSFDPKFTAGQIIVSFGDRRLYLITKAGQAISYPIAVPREQSRWQGATTVTDKRVNPSWRPTPEMLRENPRLPLWVPGGHRMNPLGVRAMYLGSSLYRIHGTDAPWTIGQAVSKGCIRMLNEDVLDLYPRVPVGTKVDGDVAALRLAGGRLGLRTGPVQPTAATGSSYKSPIGSRPIRQPTPSADAEQATDTSAMEPEADDQALAAAAEKPLEPKPVKKAEVHKIATAGQLLRVAAPAAATPAPSHSGHFT